MNLFNCSFILCPPLSPCTVLSLLYSFGSILNWYGLRGGRQILRTVIFPVIILRAVTMQYSLNYNKLQANA